MVVRYADGNPALTVKRPDDLGNRRVTATPSSPRMPHNNGAELAPREPGDQQLRKCITHSRGYYGFEQISCLAASCFWEARKISPAPRTFTRLRSALIWLMTLLADQ